MCVLPQLPGPHGGCREMKTSQITPCGLPPSAREPARGRLAGAGAGVVCAGGEGRGITSNPL